MHFLRDSFDSLQGPIDSLKDSFDFFKNSLIEQNFFSESELDSIKLEIINELDYAWQKAINDPLLDKKSLLKNVYFDNK